MTSMTTITISPPSAQGSKKVESAKKEESKEKLMVALRIRPLKNEEKSRGYRCVAEKVDDRMVVLMDTSTGSKRDVAKTSIPSRHHRSNERQYVFDTTFGADSTQQEVYEKTTQHLVKSVLDGFHATVFAYGATGSGKTYTMVGTPEHPGCMARALNELFETMENDHTVVFKVTMSYLEIYNENIRDLLNPGSGHLELRDDSRGRNITVAGLSEVTTKNTAEVMRLLQKGNKERTQEPTAANKTSSRSHALLMVNVKQTAKSRAQSRGAVKFGRLYMIDLAGSERASQTENRGKRLKEGAHINRSLLALGNVINALAEHKAKGHVNYRDSKLTRLLKEALSGNCQTVMIAHISPCEKSRDESRNTLVYADRAKNISSKVRKNVLDVSYHISQYQNIISELRGEIGRLKEKIQSEAVFGGPSSGVKKAELQEMREQMVTNFKEQMNLRARLMEIDNHILSLTMEFERFNIIINEHEMNKAKNAHDRSYTELRKKSLRKSASSKKPNGKPSETDPPDTESDKDEAYEGDKEESGFEDNGSATNEDEDEATEDQVSVANLKSDDGDASEDEEEEEAAEAAATEAASEAEEEEEEEEPEEVRQAWDELLLIQREQQRYSDIKYDLEQDLEHCKKKQSKLEDELPKRISTEEEAEILALLCKVHELEIAKVEMQRDALLKEHEVRKRDLLILKYDKQRSLCDEIIERQRELIEGAAIPMPPELMELYNLYKQELETRNKKENQFVEELNNEIIRAPSMLSLRGGPPEVEDRLHSSHHLPPIKSSEPTSTPEEKLFESRENLQEIDEGPESLPPRLGSQSSLRSSPTSSSIVAATKIPSLPPINKRKSIRRSNSFGQARVDRYADMKTRLPRRFGGRNGEMSLTLELLRSETDRESFYWPYSNGLISAVPHDCQRAKKADPPMVNNNNVTRNKVARNGLSPSDTRHSYYKCCVNVEVSALLEHWLGWDDKHHHNHHHAHHSRAQSITNNNNNYSEEMADRLVSHLIEASSSSHLPTDAKANSQDPKLWVRKFCSEVGCDVLKKQDANGKTLLHHLLSGPVQRHLASTAKVLIEAGIPTNLADAHGDTALHLVKNYFGNEEVLDLVQTLAPHVNLDLQDAKGRTLLSYAAEAGDQCISLTRLLINLGASTHSDQLGKEAEVSAFAWFLRAQMRKLDVLDEDTLYVLCTAMASEVGPARLKAVIDRSMVALGSSPEAHGPIFRRIRGLTAHYWLRPPQLRSIAVKSIRRSLGPKRLSKGNEVMSRLKVPRKLQRFVTLEEKIPVATQNSNHIHNYSSDDTNSDN